MDTIHKYIYDAVPYGINRAVTTDQLSITLRIFPDYIEQCIEDINKEHFRVCVLNGRYYKPANDEELNSYKTRIIKEWIKRVKPFIEYAELLDIIDHTKLDDNCCEILTERWELSEKEQRPYLQILDMMEQRPGKDYLQIPKLIAGNSFVPPPPPPPIKAPKGGKP